jgi:4-hydroxy-3-methylbut-2-en-1-yl diphosphate reductase
MLPKPAARWLAAGGLAGSNGGMRITLAQAMGTCFGVQDAIDFALQPRFRDRLTVVGQLVHNPQVVARLEVAGVTMIDRDQLDQIHTPEVMVTAHGAADHLKNQLRERGLVVHDATCPLVFRLHKMGRFLQGKGYRVAVIGQEQHVEVQGVIGNLDQAVVIGSLADLPKLDGIQRLGVVSQTTLRVALVAEIINAIRALPHITDLRVIDTICKPVKDRQRAIHDLIASSIDIGVVIGGSNSSNTAKLREIISAAGIQVHHIECADDLRPDWFAGKQHVGITAGTSTPQDVIEAVHARLRTLFPAC